MLMHTFPFAVN